VTNCPVRPEENCLQEASDRAEGGPSCHVPKYDLLQQALVDQLYRYMKSSREATMVVSSKGWSHARNKRVTNNDAAVYVRDYAYNHLKTYRDQVQSKKSAEQHLLNNTYGFLDIIRKPDLVGLRTATRHP
jgi:hypothetical protein